MSVITSRVKDTYPILFLFLLWLTIHALLVLKYGHRELYDANGYLKGADYILANGRLEDVHHTFYLTHIGVITFFRWLFPNLVSPGIIFQCFVSGVALIVLFKASVTIFRTRWAGFFSCVIFLCWWDNIQWNTTLMTESLACSLICFLIFVLSRFEGNVKNFIWIVILLTLGFFTRPTGVIPIVGVIFFLLTYYWDAISEVKGLNVILITGIAVFGLFAADSMFLHWDFTDEYIKGNIVTYMNRSEGTPLYEPSLRLNTSELIIPPVESRPILKMVAFVSNNPLHFLKASALKLWYLLSGVRPYYSNIHNVFTITWMLIIYVLFVFGWRQLANKTIRIFVLSTILINCLLISISTVDWDNRFYIPMEPAIVLVAGAGAAYVLQMFQRSSFFR